MAPTEPAFSGFNPDALRFFGELKANNERNFWLANKARYEANVQAPMHALAAALEGAFGEAHHYRPYRDVRFSKDKTPYKLHIAASFGGRGPSAVGSRYMHLGLGGLFVGGGGYQLPPDNLAKFRRAAEDDKAGKELAAITARLTQQGYNLEGERLQKPPRGFEADHPRIELIKYKGLYAGREWQPAAWFYTPEALDRVAQVFADVEPLVSWFRRHCA